MSPLDLFGKTKLGARYATTDETYVRFQIWGTAHTGKTIFSGSFPNVQVMDFEGGHQFARDPLKKAVPWQGSNYPVYDFSDMSTPEQLAHMISMLSEVRDIINNMPEKVPVTIVIDPMTNLWKDIQSIYQDISNKRSDSAPFALKMIKINEWSIIKGPLHRIRQILSTTKAHKIFVNHAKKDSDMSDPANPKILDQTIPQMEKSFEYESDVRLEFLTPDDKKNPKHYPYAAYVWKDRTRTFPIGTVIENPRYDMFSEIIERGFVRPPERESMNAEELKKPSPLVQNIQNCLTDPEVTELMNRMGLPPIEDLGDIEHVRYKSVKKYSGDKTKVIAALKSKLGDEVI